MFNAKLLTMAFHARHFDLVSADISISVLIKERKGSVRSIARREERGDVRGQEHFRFGLSERVEQTACKLYGVGLVIHGMQVLKDTTHEACFVCRVDCRLNHGLRRVRLKDRTTCNLAGHVP
jgi:hypothetical protein